MAGSDGWWRRAVVYQVYIRSFADGDGDGIGDIAGIRSRLPYLRELGVDALWITPWNPSPMADGGYDVADYTRRGPDVRVGRRGRHADPRRARPRAAGVAGPGPEPHLERPSVVRRGARGRARVGGPRALRLPRRPRARWRPASDRLDRRLRRVRVGARLRGRRPAGPVVPPPVRDRAAGPRLGQPRRPGDVRGRPADVVRPRRRRLPHRRRERAGQGPVGHRSQARRRRRLARRLEPRRDDAADGPGGRPRGLPRVAATRGRRGPAAGPARRGPRAVAGPARPLRPPRRAARRVQLPVPARGLGRGPPAHGHRRHARGAGRGRGVTRVGPVQPRRDPPRHAIRPHATRRSPTWETAMGLPRTWRSARGGLAPRCCCSSACPAAPTCTRARSWGCRRWRTSPRTRCGTRSGSAAATRVADATAARVPLPWSGSAPPYGFGPPGSTPWLPQPASWAALSVEAESGDPSSMLALYRAALALRASAPWPRRRRVPLAQAARRRPAVRARRRLRRRRQPRRGSGRAPGRPRCRPAIGRRRAGRGHPGGRSRAGRRGLADASLTYRLGIPIIPLGISPRPIGGRGSRTKPSHQSAAALPRSEQR